MGWPICAPEIRLPHSAYRADVAAYRPETSKQPVPGTTRLARQPIVGTTAVFECKQCRSDFLKDSHRAEETAQRLKALDARRRNLERLIGYHLPSLRNGEFLFAEYDSIDVSRYEHKTYRKVVREIGVLQSRLYGKTKFDKVTRYQCANLCYLVVEDGIMEPHEVPLNWGLLVRRGELLVLDQRPVWQDVTEPTRLALLQQIAIVCSRGMDSQLAEC